MNSSVGGSYKLRWINRNHQLRLYWQKGLKVRVHERVTDWHQYFELSGELLLSFHYQSAIVFCAWALSNYLCHTSGHPYDKKNMLFNHIFRWRTSHNLRLDSSNEVAFQNFWYNCRKGLDKVVKSLATLLELPGRWACGRFCSWWVLDWLDGYCLWGWYTGEVAMWFS